MLQQWEKQLKKRAHGQRSEVCRQKAQRPQVWTAKAKVRNDKSRTDDNIVEQLDSVTSTWSLTIRSCRVKSSASLEATEREQKDLGAGNHEGRVDEAKAEIYSALSSFIEVKKYSNQSTTPTEPYHP